MNLRCTALIIPPLHPSAFFVKTSTWSLDSRFRSTCTGRHKSLSRRQRQTASSSPLLCAPLISPPPPLFPPCVSVKLSLWQPHQRQQGSVCMCGWGVWPSIAGSFILFCLTENMNMKGQICFRLHIRFAIFFKAPV